ncbi:hypothetical protein [Nocardioides terrigena]|uniref:hypothetical protein n=1 Tax=Nocardioides terrigena TaxID=424797 RepID=UPI000D31097E|nr:hypothetical protein [Nocardioides terrigena]
MTNWNALTSFISSNYDVNEMTDSRVKMVFNTGDLRSQVVFLWRMELAQGEEWIQVESVIGPIASLDMVQALRIMENHVCGGLALSGELLTVRHAAPLANLDANEIVRPIVLVTSTADDLEKQLIGSDTF